MSEAAEVEEKTGIEIVYDLLALNKVDCLVALKGALRYFASSEGRELVDVEIELIKFSRDDDGNDRIAVRGMLVP